MRNSTAFDCHVFVSSEDRWFMVFDGMRMISTQIRRQDPCWSLPSCENIVWNVWEVAPPPHPLVPGVPRHCTVRTFHRSWAQFIQPKFPEISVQNSMDRFGPTGKVSRKLVHLVRWTTFPGRTGWKIWMNGPRPQTGKRMLYKFYSIVLSFCYLAVMVEGDESSRLRTAN